MDFADKKEILEKVIQFLKEKRDVLINSAFEAKEASTNEESKAENKYDTRGLEASYLAAGQAQRAQEIQEQIYQCEKVEIKDFSLISKITISALVEIEIDEAEVKWLFLLPVGGIEIQHKGQKIQSLNIESPLGALLFNSKKDDEFTLNKKEYVISEVI